MRIWIINEYQLGGKKNRKVNKPVTIALRKIHQMPWRKSIIRTDWKVLRWPRPGSRGERQEAEERSVPLRTGECGCVEAGRWINVVPSFRLETINRRNVFVKVLDCVPATESCAPSQISPLFQVLHPRRRASTSGGFFLLRVNWWSSSSSSSWWWGWSLTTTRKRKNQQKKVFSFHNPSNLSHLFYQICLDCAGSLPRGFIHPSVCDPQPVWVLLARSDIRGKNNPNELRKLRQQNIQSVNWVSLVPGGGNNV